MSEKQIWGIRHVSLPVADVGRAADYYCRYFGFEIYYRGEDDWAMVRKGETTLSFIQTKSISQRASTGTKHESHFGVVVADRATVDQVRQDLVASGLNAGKAVEHRDGSYGFYFKDLDGNVGECIFVLHRSATDAAMLKEEARILIAHGGRDPKWAVPIEALRAQVETHLSGAVCVCAYMEFMPPSLEAVADDLVRQHPKLKRIFVVPIFLSTSGHVENDIKPIVGRLRGRYPKIHWELTSAVGESRAVRDAMVAEISWLRSPDGSRR